MAWPPPPSSPASWPPPPLTPAFRGRVRGKGAKKRDSKYSRSNTEGFIPFPTPFPTFVFGYYMLYGSFGVGPCGYGRHPYGQQYQCVRSTILPQYQMGMNWLVQNGSEVDMVHAQAQASLFGVWNRGTGVFHSPQGPREYNRARAIANYNNNQGAGMSTKQGGGSNSNQNRSNKKYASKGKKNGGSVKVKDKKEECYDHSLPPGIVLPLEWNYEA